MQLLFLAAVTILRSRAIGRKSVLETARNLIRTVSEYDTLILCVGAEFAVRRRRLDLGTYIMDLAEGGGIRTPDTGFSQYNGLGTSRLC